ncbi:oligosaccharyl transferase, archaeosortase A system-associated [Methanofollis formosanus]|uniref:dolichyl-phosphooligosaccharide-protein glycotransferase n=1 Tax=Methanofollis formosanus TaxID=299308 RepID=A0A8G1A2I7_9EURY|nr:oligosaccharyl transferase, archaeosortase A system-associated [Methanofollis formosanus]QYZ79241.1 oligosaccharyl transferase, archaeosortase A system-associated [Methanofollis formosanus]
MPPFDQNTRNKIIVIGLVALFSVLALWVRLIPMAGLTASGEVNLLGNDAWYNFRQVELLVANGLAYAWFDPMTLYPTGDIIYWGPLFTTIAAVFAIISGASTTPEMAVAASMVPAFMGAAMVPVVFLIGRRLADWKTGLFAAAFMAFVAGSYYYRSLFGFLDHHIAETLFSTIFALAYIVALSMGREQSVDLKIVETLKRPAVLGAVAGVAYLLGLFVMPTMILFALIVALYTLFQYLLDTWQGRESTDLLVINTVLFAVATVGLLIFGFKVDGFGLSRYSLGHVVAYLAIIAGTWALHLLAQATKERPKYFYPLVLAAIGMVVAVVLKVAVPALFDILVGNFFAFFGQSAEANTVEEAMGWSFQQAWSAFGYGLVLMAGGFAVLGYEAIAKRRPEHLFVLVWSALLLVSTWQHLRYEYYLAANVALLAGLCAGTVFDWGWKGLANSGKKAQPQQEETNTGKGKKKTTTKKPEKKAPGPDPVRILGMVVVGILAVAFIVTSFQTDIALSESVGRYGGMNHPDEQQWQEALFWMEGHTPETGVDYYQIYEKEGFQYPPESYGVMSWWDYGHFITTIAHRIPNNNPFQHGVVGPNGSAAFFVTGDEDEAVRIMEADGTRYIMTDYQMDTGKFHAMATWDDPVNKSVPFIPAFLVQDPRNPGTLQTTALYTQAYFESMTSRLHNFDGSMTEPSQAIYIEYAEAGASGYTLPAITNAQMMDAAAAEEKAKTFNANAKPGTKAAVYGTEGRLDLPPQEVPALRHFRLVFESSRSMYTGNGPDIKQVKVFEYVKGARIKGEGTIEVDLVTNTGRTFTYRQESENGEFVVPYSTSGTPYDVKATGPYRIVGTGTTVDVPENAVMQGLVVGA